MQFDVVVWCSGIGIGLIENGVLRLFCYVGLCLITLIKWVYGVLMIYCHCLTDGFCVPIVID